MRSDEELDLGPVINWLSRQLKKMGAGLAIFFTGIARFFWVLILAAGVGLGAGWLFHHFSPPVYYSDMTLSSSHLSRGYYEDFLQNLEIYLLDENFEGLARTLDIPATGAEGINKIKLLESRPSKDSTIMGTLLRILVVANDPAVYEYLGPKLMQYLAGNTFAVKVHEVQTRRLKTSIDALENEIIQLDSLKRVVEKSMLSERISPGLLFMESPDPIQVYEERNKLFQMQKDQEAKLLLSRNLTMLDDFTPRTEPSEPVLSDFLKIFGLAAIGAGLVITTIMQARLKKV
ncbi:MAG: hypothetical protein WD077_10715 [Bacteroidia bacterium]